MVRQAAAILLLLTVASGVRADTPEEPSYIVFHNDGLPSVLPLVGNFPAVDSGLGEDLNVFTLISNPPAGLDYKDLKVEQRNKRCLTIGADGQHLDFQDWKPAFTPWREMKRRQWNKWENVRFQDADFPSVKYPQAELIEKVKEQLKGYEPGDWIERAKSCGETGAEGDCSVSDCSIEIRMLDARKDNELLRTFVIRLPMGC